MARREPIEIALGERSFRIRALTIDQMQAIEAIVVARDGYGGASIPVARDVLKIALDRDHGSSFSLGEIECEPQEIAAAFRAVLVHGGFLRQDSSPGEGRAAAATHERTGDGFAAGSPPGSD